MNKPDIFVSLFYLIVTCFLNNYLIVANLLFICNSGSLLDYGRVCDGQLDCYDGSDELKELCYRTVCPRDQFKCNYGACVDKFKKCNGIRDCADGSDEMQCGRKMNSCKQNEFHCDSGKCIPAILICDTENDCIDNSDESDIICEQQLCPLDTFKCQFGGCIPKDAKCDGFIDCLDGSDESTILCLAKQCPQCRQTIKCPAIKSNRIDAICEHNDNFIRCDQPMLSGTRVKYTCKEYFRPVNKKHANNDMTECQDDGNWSRELLQCEPECGRLSLATPLVVNGREVNAPFPWHISMYVRRQNQYKFWCGATLISEAVVLTAAHCVWGIPAEHIKLVMGTTISNLNETNDNLFSRHFSVKQIIIHPLYLDKFGNYGSDIALLEINGNVDLDDNFLPACIDWELDDITSHLSHQNLGMVMGMGVSEDNLYSDKLKLTTLPVIDNRQCIERQKEDFRKYVTFTTFCAGWENGTGVCNGDSGGGLVFLTESTDRWFIQGIVSLSPRRTSSSLCDPLQYTIFTKVGIYSKWIEFVLLSIHHSHRFNNEMGLVDEIN